MESPLHLAIIPDGNRRWAKPRGLKPWKGHEAAINVLQDVIEHCRKDDRIGTLTMWLFSTENWKRDPLEISKLMGMLEKFLRKRKDTWLQNAIREDL